MSDDESNKPLNKFINKTLNKQDQLVKIPLHFHSFDAGEGQAEPSAFNDTQYKVRLVRYTAHLKHLLDNPPVLKPVCCDIEVHHEQVDNYLWVVGEIISGLYEMNHLCEVMGGVTRFKD